MAIYPQIAPKGGNISSIRWMVARIFGRDPGLREFNQKFSKWWDLINVRKRPSKTDENHFYCIFSNTFNKNYKKTIFPEKIFPKTGQKFLHSKLEIRKGKRLAWTNCHVWSPKKFRRGWVGSLTLLYQGGQYDPDLRFLGKKFFENYLIGLKFSDNS